MTNADKIRSMSNDELVQWIKIICKNARAGLSPTGGWDEWLKQED